MQLEIKNVGDLMRLKYALEREFGSFPKNIIIESKDIINECSEFMPIDKGIKQTDTCIKIYDVKVMRGVAELY